MTRTYIHTLTHPDHPGWTAALFQTPTGILTYIITGPAGTGPCTYVGGDTPEEGLAGIVRCASRGPRQSWL